MRLRGFSTQGRGGGSRETTEMEEEKRNAIVYTHGPIIWIGKG